MVRLHPQTPAGPPRQQEILDICRRVGNGDPEAKRRLMELLFDRIHKTASYLTTDVDEAGDIAQAACVEVLLSAGTFRGEAALTYWADRVTRRTAAKVFVKKTRRQRIWESVFQPPRQSTSLEEQAGRTSVRERLTPLVQSLERRQREVVVFRYVHGYSNQEVADLCGIPLETARDRLKKGRAALRRKVMADPLLAEWIREWGDQ